MAVELYIRYSYGTHARCDLAIKEELKRCKFTFDELCLHLGTMLRCNPESAGGMDELAIFALDVLEKATAQERAPFMEAVGELLKHSSSEEIHVAVCKVVAVCNIEERRPFASSLVQLLCRYMILCS